MAKVKVNFDRILQKNKSFEKKVINKITNQFEESKEVFLNEFNEHPVTREIENGASSSNISNTLNGIGNLFSFIGFKESSNPIQDLKNIIKSNFYLSTKKINKGFRFSISYPNFENIKKSTPMPWEGGNSWVMGIEKGISGFSNYMYKKFIEGRSKEALQSENKIRGGSYRPTKYLSTMINNFVKNIKNIK